MRVHKKLAGKAHTIGDLKQFIEHAESEGFNNDTMLNPQKYGEVAAIITPKGVDIFLDEVTGESSVKDKLPYIGTCPECRQEMPIGANKLIPVHYRGDTSHDSARCYGVGKMGRSLRENI